MSEVTHHIIVKGKVQGVFFRASTRKMAISLGLTGWVRNTVEGDVEIMASGQAAKISDLEDWCSKGPIDANVEQVIVHEVPVQTFDSFTIRK